MEKTERELRQGMAAKGIAMAKRCMADNHKFWSEALEFWEEYGRKWGLV